MLYRRSTAGTGKIERERRERISFNFNSTVWSYHTHID